MYAMWSSAAQPLHRHLADADERHLVEARGAKGGLDRVGGLLGRIGPTGRRVSALASPAASLARSNSCFVPSLLRTSRRADSTRS